MLTVFKSESNSSKSSAILSNKSPLLRPFIHSNNESDKKRPLNLINIKNEANNLPIYNPNLLVSEQDDFSPLTNLKLQAVQSAKSQIIKFTVTPERLAAHNNHNNVNSNKDNSSFSKKKPY